MKVSKNGKEWLLRAAACLGAGSILMVLFICLFVNFGFDTVIGREAVYISALLILTDVLLLCLHERRMVREEVYPPLSRGMRGYRTTVKLVWCVGLLLLLASGVLLLCGVSMAEFWSYFTVIGGYILLALGWAGELMVHQRRRMAASVAELETARKAK